MSLFYLDMSQLRPGAPSPHADALLRQICGAPFPSNKDFIHMCTQKKGSAPEHDSTDAQNITYLLQQCKLLRPYCQH